MGEEVTEVVVPEQVETVEEGCRRLGATLGLDRPVEEAVFRAAMNDATYAHNLFVCRHTTAFRDKLLASPPSTAGKAPSTTELLTRAASALWRWSRSGFSRIDEATRKRRVEACRACPHLRPPGKKLLQRIASDLTEELEGHVCGLCGCIAGRKASVVTEACPAPHPKTPGFTRWGEPM